MANKLGDSQTSTPAPRGQPLPVPSPDELDRIFNILPACRHALLKILKHTCVSTTDSDMETDSTITIPLPISNSGELSFDQGDAWIKHLQQ